MLPKAEAMEIKATEALINNNKTTPALDKIAIAYLLSINSIFDE